MKLQSNGGWHYYVVMMDGHNGLSHGENLATMLKVQGMVE
jgi:hypothetical protein